MAWRCHSLISKLAQAHKATLEIVTSEWSDAPRGELLCIPTKPSPTAISGSVRQNRRDECRIFRESAKSIRRTHLYFYSTHDDVYSITHSDTHDVTLLTQFTLDRFPVFERLIHNWKGPVHAVIYVNDSSVPLLQRLIDNSTVLKNYQDANFHLVYNKTVSLTFFIFVFHTWVYLVSLVRTAFRWRGYSKLKSVHRLWFNLCKDATSKKLKWSSKVTWLENRDQSHGAWVHSAIQ